MTTILKPRTDEPTYMKPKSRWILKGLSYVLVAGIAFVLHPSGNPIVVKSDLPGPTQIVNGVPVGYPQTQQGAISAAMNYSQAYGDASMLPDAQRDSVVGLFVASNSQTGERQTLADLHIQVATQLGINHVFAATIPITGKVTSFSSDQAVVRLWTVGFATGPNQKGLIQSCGMTDMTLVWENGDWKFSSAEDPGSCPTPVPDLDSSPATPDQVWDIVNGTARFFHAPIQ